DPHELLLVAEEVLDAGGGADRAAASADEKDSQGAGEPESTEDRHLLASAAPRFPVQESERMGAGAAEGLVGGGRLVGLAHVLLFDTPPGDGRTHMRRAHLDSIVVDRSARRRGCGRALVAASGRWAKQRGAVQLVLTVWSGNVEAERFYGALGF